jgi:hypothetical protein
MIRLDLAQPALAVVSFDRALATSVLSIAIGQPDSSYP